MSLNSFLTSSSSLEDDCVGDDKWDINSVITYYGVTGNQALHYEADESEAIYYEVIQNKELCHEVVMSEENYYSEVIERKELIHYGVHKIRDKTAHKNKHVSYEVVKNKGIKLPDLPPPPKAPPLPPLFTGKQSSKVTSFYHSPSDTNLQSYSWFHGYIERTEAEKLLRGTRDGTFLVREKPEEYSLSLFNEGHVTHYHIHGNKTKSEFFLTDEEKFQSMPELVRHYSLYSDALPMQYPLERIGRPNPPQVDTAYEAPNEVDEWELSRSDFNVSDRIGGGQYGDVYKAVLKSSGEVVAVKVFKVIA